jgi:hypothetical protein
VRRKPDSGIVRASLSTNPTGTAPRSDRNPSEVAFTGPTTKKSKLSGYSSIGLRKEL